MYIITGIFLIAQIILLKGVVDTTGKKQFVGKANW